jgi:hypothetical protein
MLIIGKELNFIYFAFGVENIHGRIHMKLGPIAQVFDSNKYFTSL